MKSCQRGPFSRSLSTDSRCPREPHGHRGGITLEPERVRDADRRGVCIQRAVLREQSGGKGTAGKMGDGFLKPRPHSL